MSTSFPIGSPPHPASPSSSSEVPSGNLGNHQIRPAPLLQTLRTACLEREERSHRLMTSIALIASIAMGLFTTFRFAPILPLLERTLIGITVFSVVHECITALINKVRSHEDRDIANLLSLPTHPFHNSIIRLGATPETLIPLYRAFNQTETNRIQQLSAQ